MKGFAALSAFITRHMSFFVVLVSLFALFKPGAFSWAVPRIPMLLGMVMFGMGMMLTFEDFRTIFRHPKGVLLGILGQFTIMPGLAWLLVTFLHLPYELAIGVMLVGTCPGGTASNVITYLAKGDVALSVSMTLVSTVLSPLITPALMLFLAGEIIEVPFYSMMVSICQVVILPVLLGLVLNALFGNIVRRFLLFLPLISVVAIVLTVGGVVSVNATKIADLGLITALVVVLHNVLGCLLGYLLAHLAKVPDTWARAISLEVGMQNSGLAAALAISHFGVAQALPGAIFSVVHNITGSILANIFAARDRKKECLGASNDG